jgi:hypothetical protein
MYWRARVRVACRLHCKLCPKEAWQLPLRHAQERTQIQVEIQ